MVRVIVRNTQQEGGYFEDEEFNQYQIMAYKRWANAYGYETWQGYVTARHGYEWKDYSFLRENSP